MDRLNFPARIAVPFANNAGAAYRREIPISSQGNTGDASYTDGFPALTFTPVTAGGAPPDGRDFNGIFYAITNLLRSYSAGVLPQFDAKFASATGGYPAGAVLSDARTGVFWVSTVDGNTTQPGANGANWQSLFLGLAPIDSPSFTTQAQFTYGGCTFRLQTDKTAVFADTAGKSTFTVVPGSVNAYQPFNAYSNINAKYDIVANGAIGLGGSISTGGPASNNFQWTGSDIGGYNPYYSGTNGFYQAIGAFYAYATNGACAFLGTGVLNGPVVVFRNSQGQAGSITTNGGGVAYNTSSDYRIKSDIEPLLVADALARLSALKPSSFRMNADPAREIVTGFVAHEFGESYPWGLTGEKDATKTNDRGETIIDPQQIDQGKALPDVIVLLQDALQRLVAAETRIADLIKTNRDLAARVTAIETKGS